MPLLVNLRHLEHDAVKLNGQLPAAELNLELRDDVMRAEQPLQYQIEVQLLDDCLLAQGDLLLPLDCECVRCLKPFVYRLELKRWAVHLPLEGEEKTPVINDCVDLTPHIREDILLGFPQHPLCEKNCRGLPKPVPGKAKKTSGAKQEPSAWAVLDRLKIDNLN